jgi:hypothetical protein
MPTDPTKLARRLQEIEAECRIHSEKLEELRREGRALLNEADREFREFVPTGKAPGRPRSIQAKLAISIGRTVDYGVKARWEKIKTTEVALVNVAKTAKRCGAVVPGDVIDRINEAINRRLAPSR